MENLWIELIRLIPSVLWFLLVVVLLAVFHRPIRRELLPRLGGFKAMGVELSFVRESIDAAVELAEKSPNWKVTVPHRDRERALNRARRHLDVFRDARFLWVDDHPENNVNERRMFRRLGVTIDSARSSGEGLVMLDHESYDLVLSDMARGDKPTAGLELLSRLREGKANPPVVFYIGSMDADKGVPPGAFGITNRPDELVHLTLDALERKKYEKG